MSQNKPFKIKLDRDWWKQDLPVTYNVEVLAPPQLEYKYQIYKYALLKFWSYPIKILGFSYDNTTD